MRPRLIAAEQLAELWQRHAAGLILLNRHHCANPEDCVQEAFIRLASQVPAPDDPLAWLARVARNAAISQSRADARRRHREQAVAAVRTPWFTEGASDSLGENYGARLPEALASLSSDQREVVVAHVWAGLSFRQIAEVMEISKSTANRLFQTGLSHLKHQLLIHESPMSVPHPESKR